MNSFHSTVKKRHHLAAIACFLTALFLSANSIAQPFVHPGILHSQEDLDRMKKAVAEKQEPTYSGYQVFIQNPASSAAYKMQGPMAMVGRNPTVGQETYDSDANAAHQNAILWYLTGEKAYADKAIELVNAWSYTLKSITGRDAILMAGLGPFKMTNAAEILRYTHSGWKEADIKQAEVHFKTVIYPVIQNFALFANGNWDAAAIKTMLSIGVFCNDRAIYERALQYYVNGAGNGRLSHYIINTEGQSQESGRDQAHTQLGIAMLAECSAIAWNQGLDLYSYQDNRLLKGFEYTANYNLGNEVPFSETTDYTGKYHHKEISTLQRGQLRAVYEQVYNHYVHKMGLAAPFTTQAAAKVRPEGPGRPGADHPGYGTLYFSIPQGKAAAAQKTVVPVAPGGLVVLGSAAANTITWVRSIGAAGYSVKRSEKPGGPYTVIAKNIAAETYTDKQVKPGKVYYYTVTARNKAGESGNGFAASAGTGLPQPWKRQDVGKLAIPGTSQYDGEQYRLTGSGMGIDSLKDALNFTAIPVTGDSEITARFVPQLSSQLSQFGVSIRQGTDALAKHASLVVYPRRSGQIEAPDWQVRLLARNEPGGKTQLVQSLQPLPASAMTWGRLTGYYWLRIQRKGNEITGYTSPDGETWTALGNVTLPLAKPAFIGLIANSGYDNLSTTIQFDHVVVK